MPIKILFAVWYFLNKKYFMNVIFDTKQKQFC